MKASSGGFDGRRVFHPFYFAAVSVVLFAAERFKAPAKPVERAVVTAVGGWCVLTLFWFAVKSFQGLFERHTTRFLPAQNPAVPPIPLQVPSAGAARTAARPAGTGPESGALLAGCFVLGALSSLAFHAVTLAQALAFLHLPTAGPIGRAFGTLVKAYGTWTPVFSLTLGLEAAAIAAALLAALFAAMKKRAAIRTGFCALAARVAAVAAFGVAFVKTVGPGPGTAVFATYVLLAHVLHMALLYLGAKGAVDLAWRGVLK
ncbi:MAG: hypothetical protein JXR37_06560 [Kiritimatiellae bacterium]|nr:hypothetical protein [Kiritimatiellia bacterium]